MPSRCPPNIHAARNAYRSETLRLHTGPWAHIMKHNKGRTVLVVEDEVLIRVLIVDELESLGLTVLEAGNADEALPILLSDVPIQVLFTDVRMPGSMDGIELVRRARAIRPHLKVIVASGHRTNISLKEADAFFGKPFSVAEVASMVKQAMGL
jgi:CheY-like chemotaxis protein